MPKLALMLFAVVFALAGTYGAQAAAKGKGKDQATCSRLIQSNPAYLTRAGCAQACAAAIRACMRGAPY